MVAAEALWRALGPGGRKWSAGFIPLLAVLITAPVAVAQPTSFEVHEYMHDFHVSASRATSVLETQSIANQADIVGQLEARLGDRYAGIWFDNQDGEFVVPVLDLASRDKVDDTFAAAGLHGSPRFSQADFSWKELQGAQSRLENQLRAQVGASGGHFLTSLDPRTNSVVVDEEEPKAGAAVRATGDLAGIPVEVREAHSPLNPVPASCGVGGSLNYNCDPPLRGGNQLGAAGCTVGFKALGISTGNRYVISAGHCGTNFSGTWTAPESLGVQKNLGPTETLAWGSSGRDLLKIRANGYFWDVNPWPALVMEWNQSNYAMINSERPITSEAHSYIGQYACHTGMATGTSCGYVRTAEYNKVEGTDEGHYFVVEHLSELYPVCNGGGDSGGPVYSGHAALGINSFADDRLPTCAQYSLFTEITEDTQYLGVSIAPNTNTQTWIDSATGLNGNPGWFSVSGQVSGTGAPVNGTVNIELKKYEGSKWVPKQTLQANVTNGKFAINNGGGVGPGSWLAKAEFPAQAGLGKSTSDENREGHFEVKDGYRIVNKNSGKCLDVLEGSKENGARLQQWECLDPKSIQNQVYTLRPGNGSYELIARHSGRCVDVVNADTANGAGLQQWTCNGFAQQKWTGVAAGEYINFVAKHSGKCMDVTGAGTGNGTLIQQWDCNGSAQQKWYLQSVDSAPTPTETFLTVPPEERLNGQYGFASAHGYVKTGAYPIGGNYVNVKYEKEVSPGNFEFVKANHPTLNNEGFYESKYEGLGSGNWRIWTEFPGAGNLAASRSATVNFHLGTGYRFVFRHSGKCLNLYGNSAALGTKLVQWDCFANPNPSDGEVFTLVPFHNGNDFEILINSVSTPESGRCVDVTGAGTGNGVKLQSYLCYNGAYSNQLWHWIPISGQEPWQAFISVSSGKCMGVEGDYTYNGANVWQWECLWVPNQQWKFQGVG
jgi:hypothetical protein